MQLSRTPERNHSILYNSLPQVEDAAATLNSRDKAQVLEKLCDLLLDYALDSTIGIRLCHRHSSLQPGEIMLESPSVDESGRPCLATQASPWSESSQSGTLVLNSFLYAEGGMRCFEFSKMSELNLCETQTSLPSDFSAEFVRVTKTYGAEHLLAPCLRPIAFTRKYVKNDETLLEFSDPNARANILQIVPKNSVRSTDLETSWHAWRHEKRCSSACSSRCAYESRCRANWEGKHHFDSSHDFRHRFEHNFR